jgi:hypothetical protein
MKILMTGFTRLQCRLTNKQRSIQKIDVPEYIYDAFIKLGHQVDWKETKVGDDLTGYDLLFISVASCNSFNAPHSLGGFWAMGQPVKSILFYDDWQVKNTMSSARTLLKMGDKQLFKIVSGKPIYCENTDQVKTHRNKILETVNSFTTIWLDQWKGLLPRYNWGDVNIVLKNLPKACYLSIDPSSQVPLISPTIIEKEKRWCCASLMPHLDWVEKQNLKWPVSYFGSKKVAQTQVCPRLDTEQTVQEEYNKVIGILSPEYPQSGSGWFRSRYLYSANCRSIIWGGYADAKALGPAYTFSAAEIEERDDFKSIAEEQAAIFEKYKTTNDFFINQVNEICKI